jgi:superfamily II DNA or RNA helicase
MPRARNTPRARKVPSFSNEARTPAPKPVSHDRRSVTEAYRQLSELEQTLVQLLSVIYEPVNRTLILNCANHAGLRADNKSFTIATLKPYLDRLFELGILLQDPGQGPQCHPLLIEIASRDAVKAGRFDTLAEAVEAGSPITQRWKGGPRYFRSPRQLVREVRIGLYRQDLNFIRKQLQDYKQYNYGKEQTALDQILLQVVTNPFDPEWCRTLTPQLYEIVLTSVLENSMLHLQPVDAALELLQQDCASGKATPELRHVLLIEQLLLRGRLDEAEEALTRVAAKDRDRYAALTGTIAFLRGDTTTAIKHYTQALQALKHATGKRKIYFQSMTGLFFVLALMKTGDPDHLADAESYADIGRQAKHWLSPTYGLLEQVLQIQRGELFQKPLLIMTASQLGDHSLDILLRALCLYWVDRDEAKKHLPRRMEVLYQGAEAAGYEWLALEAGELLGRLQPRSTCAQKAEVLRKLLQIQPLTDIIRPQEAWELCLNALAHLNAPPQTAAPTQSSKRLAWFLTSHGGNWSLQPREQSLGKRGQWSKGRNIALKRLKGRSKDFSYLTPQDLQVCSHIETYAYGYYGQSDYTFDDKAIASLIGHPLVFWEDTSAARVEVVKGEPELLVKKMKGNQLTLQFSPKLPAGKSIVVTKESPTRLRVIQITPDHRRIAQILGDQNQLTVPAQAQEQVLKAINAISSVVTVHSDIGGGVASAKEVASDATPRIHLLPAGSGLHVAVLVQPFPQGGPYYHPGEGGATVIAELDGQRLQTTRDLRDEKKRARSVIEACPSLLDQPEEDGEWWIDDPEACLELLLDLQDLGDSAVVEWPEGETLRVTPLVDLGQLQLKIQQQRDWFAASGELQVDTNLVLDMQKLLGLLDQTPSRFVPLGDGQFLALTQAFRKRLDELRTFSEQQGKGVRFHPLAALAMEDWLDEVGDLKADKHWKAHLKRLKDIQDFEPQLPLTLQAELRDYQVEGFRWLARLAHWGVGACLADDMGLGKTLQAIAVILTRAPQGPTLIVAPTSVCMNWISEAERFAPTLNAIQLGSGESSGDRQQQRQQLLDQLQPFDMLVCSYGLLQQEEVAEMLAKVEWQTIVLDEAQSIKNFATKRSQAAMSLQGGFKLITTGTPIENHLGELWNLFRFINPGLLGSLERFNENFATPIERYQDKQARNRLKKLIQPFLLRRTKSQVLEELPERTEIVLEVELSPEEMAFYEALRQQAISKLSESDATAGAKHLQVLAEIMKLRRACCNARLVMPETPLPSAKLQVFGEVLEELLANQHKALVFSQFVDHLKILRNYLDEHKIAYQYLDGSTPAPERKKRVNAFQAGQGDVFLISLKAGGTGLNLTAADYVIHMDPWWNPAVEDQASDRAHRIGQQRPVTIYRLVAQNTIEEKIVDLHRHKRDLADGLLEGADMSGKMSTDELLHLLQEG